MARIDQVGAGFYGPRVCLACTYYADGKCKLNPPEQPDIRFDDTCSHFNDTARAYEVFKREFEKAQAEALETAKTMTIHELQRPDEEEN